MARQCHLLLELPAKRLIPFLISLIVLQMLSIESFTAAGKTASSKSSNYFSKPNKEAISASVEVDKPSRDSSIDSLTSSVASSNSNEQVTSDSNLLKVQRNGFPGSSSSSSPGGSGIFGIDKGAPDLQFGLALTIPFISLATEKLVNSLSQPSTHRGYRSWQDLMSIFKLNVSGLVLAAVVGIGALILIPTIFHGQGGILKGFGSNLFDNLIHGGIGGSLNKHFGYGQYESYGNSYDPYNKNYYSSTPYGFQRADGRSRALGDNEGNSSNPSDNSSIWSKIQSSIASNWVEVETCGLYALCIRGKDAPPNSSFEDYMSKVSDLNPYLKQMEQAFQLGQLNKTVDCSTQFKECNQIPKFVNSVGSYLFS